MDITITLAERFNPSLAHISEELSNAMAAYAVQQRMLLDEVAVYYNGLQLDSYRRPKAVSYTLGKRKLEWDTRKLLASA